MSKRLKTFFFILPFLLVIIGLIQFESKRQKENQLSQEEKKEPPIFFLDHSITTHYDFNGNINYQLNSDHLEYYKDSKYAKVSKPYFIFYSAAGKSWHSRSDQATLYNQSGEIHLDGNVRAWQPERNLELTTQQLVLSDSRSTAETDKLVNLKFSAGTTKSIGMILNMHDEKLQLLSHVEGRYHAD